MKKALLFTALAIAGLAAAASAGIPGRFMQYPTISGETVVFTYEGDLWSVPAAGGAARRLTSHPGTEEAAKFSPDGRTLAFTADYDGAPALYTMPATGGAPRRLTYFGAGVQAVAWSPDGKKIVFRSSHEATFRPMARLYAVAASGGYPEPLPMDRGILCSYSPDGTKLAYNRRGLEEYYWKRYKGGRFVDLWLYDFGARQYTQLSDYVGKSAYPMYAAGKLYFVSDRDPKGISNLYTIDPVTKKVDQVTSFDDFDVQWPTTDGKRIVFVRAGRLHVFDPAAGTTRAIEVDIASDRWQLADRTVNARDYIQSFSVSNDGRTAVFEARGDIFLVPTDESLPTRNLTGTTSSRERFPQLSPDGKKVAFFSDKTGDYQLYLADIGGDKPWEPLTTALDRTVYHLEWSPDGSKILFGNKDFALFYLDVATKKLTKFATSNQMKNDEFFWEVSDYAWSPDSKWITYSFVQFNRNNRVFLYSLEQNRNFPVTSDFYDSLNPSFDANGNYLYFLSYRDFSTRIDIFEDNHVIEHPVQVMAVQLKAGPKPPFERADKKKDAEPFRVDVAGLDSRVFPLPVAPGIYFHLKAGNGVVGFDSLPTYAEAETEELFKPGGADKWTLHVFDMASQKDVVATDTVVNWRLSANGEQIITRKADATFQIATPDKIIQNPGSLGTKLPLGGMQARVRPIDEWTQIFNDTWRWYRDFFYDENMHGRDWKKLGDTLRAFIPDLSSRADLNWLLSQMVGDLNVSHTYIGGGDQGPQRAPEVRTFTGLLGADLAADASGYLKLGKILGPTAYNADLTAPLVRPGVDVKEGDFLIAIDGHELKASENPYQYLQVTRGQKVKLTVNSKPTAVGARTIEVEPLRSESTLRYNRWLSDNIDAVLRASNGEIGYMHITAMSTDNVGQFDKFWRAFRYKKGLIIDVRGNGGGWTEYFIIDKLERKMTAYNVLRGMEPFRYPGSTTTGQVAVLSNEYNGSDGEAFIEHFKARKLGTVIGVPSWGGLVGILNRQLTIDNGTVEQSNNSFYNDQGKWIVESHGADPDIVLDNDPASASAGRDAQLEKAIEVLQKQIKEKPFTFPARPKYPIR
ncbi:MAG TPA: S41 family peptidase [Vicinamibacterales bacterium]